jgi:hypothetical protein
MLFNSSHLAIKKLQNRTLQLDYVDLSLSPSLCNFSKSFPCVRPSFYVSDCVAVHGLELCINYVLLKPRPPRASIIEPSQLAKGCTTSPKLERELRESSAQSRLRHSTRKHYTSGQLNCYRTYLNI